MKMAVVEVRCAITWDDAEHSAPKLLDVQAYFQGLIDDDQSCEDCYCIETDSLTVRNAEPELLED